MKAPTRTPAAADAPAEPTVVRPVFGRTRSLDTEREVPVGPAAAAPSTVAAGR